jgi:Adenylate and Guanylate cyclase catalytic domain
LNVSIIIAMAIIIPSPYTIATDFSLIQTVTSGAQLLLTIIAILVFVMYDNCVLRRHHELVLQSAQATDIVSSMFPEKLRQQLMESPSSSAKQSDASKPENGGGEEECGLRKSSMNTADTASSHSCLMTKSVSSSDVSSNAPIAELYPETTVMLADLAGFTAWSADRDPVQVFLLLESIFLEFDRLATRRDVYKVETVGDCYDPTTPW